MAEEFADSIMDQMQSLTVPQLVDLCDKYSVTVPDDKKDKRGALLRLLTAFVTSQSSDTDGEAVLGRLDGDTGKMLKRQVKQGRREMIKQRSLQQRLGCRQ